VLKKYTADGDYPCPGQDAAVATNGEVPQVDAVEKLTKEQMYAVKERALVIGRLPCHQDNRRYSPRVPKVPVTPIYKNSGHLCG